MKNNKECVSGNKSFLQKFKREWPLHLLLLPAALLLVIYRYIPMAGIIIAFKDYTPARGFIDSPWTGLANFRILFEMPGFVNTISNTLIITVSKIVI